MRTARAWLSRLAGIFNKRRRDCELTDELESHLQMHIDDNLRRGMSLEEARRQAFIALGGVERTKEIYRERKSLPMIEPCRTCAMACECCARIPASLRLQF